MKILFLCSANSARSIMAEAIMRHFAGSEIDVFSAGSQPTHVEPEALAALSALNVTTEGLHSKAIESLGEMAFDYVISLCDRARLECQADFQGVNFIAWDFSDPVSSKENDAFLRTAKELSERIRMFLLVLRKRMQQPHLFNSPQDFFKIMADPLRLTMILMVARHTELCVCDFVEMTGMSQPKVSRHLAQLREYGLLLDRRDHRWVHYRLNPALPDWMRKTIAVTAEHNPQLGQYSKNAKE
ncbi:metalloregulator ArsR/SmtB family transcription factor [Pseudidiomarina marina]|uniref:ArsR family transcriptional regulator n=1 Tax=Pseudidiomarina marina TaxID=502366 RepID=A0A432YEG5_9GAMM|nr:metalloregulator ArsR/SmtB family transcription factor [Pseudidiomarina marina]PHR66202.1 MAG: ArsR family transcriptional regulator [Idiomarina sp.]RUO59342.1 ArsR family transcriptional regulator [Pseudidiomarina marina]